MKRNFSTTLGILALALAACSADSGSTSGPSVTDERNKAWTIEDCHAGSGLVLSGKPQRCKIGDIIYPIAFSGSMAPAVATPLENTILEDIKKLGLTYTYGAPMPDPIIGENGATAAIQNELVMFFAFPSASEARQIADSMKRGEPLPDGRSVYWEQGTLFYVLDSLLAVYQGNSAAVMDALQTAQ